MVGPNFQKPTAPVASQWLEARDRAVITDREDIADWWAVFKDKSLNQLVQMAFEQNLSLQTAGIRVIEARAQLGIAIGEFYPQQQQIAGAVDYNKDPNSFLPRFWNASLGLQAAWELDVWGKFRRGIQAADAAYLASIASYDDVLVALIGDVATTYVAIRTIEQQIAIARENVHRQRDALAIAEAKYKGGTAAERDVYQAQNVLYATQATIPQLTLQLQQAKNALCVLLGLPPLRLDALLAGSRGIPIAPRAVAVGIPIDLLRRRPDVRRAELAAASQSAQIGYAKADLLPAFSLTGTFGGAATTLGGGSLGDLFTGKGLTYSAGPSVQWNIFNYGRITNNVRVQDARLQALLTEYANTVLKAQKDVEDGLAQFLQSRSQAALLRKSVAAAEGAFRIAMKQYQGGIADFTTVLLAEQNLFQAQTNLAQAKGNISTGLIAVYRALGGGLQIREGHDFVPAWTREIMAERTNWGWGGASSGLLRPIAPELPTSDDIYGNNEVPLPQW